MKQMIVWLSLWLSLPAPAGTDSLLEYALKDLNTGRSEALLQFQGKPVIISFFEPECPWCFKQLQDLEQMQLDCQQMIQPLAIGVNGRPAGLKQLFARTRVKFPAFIASNRMLADIGGVPATPISVFIDQEGKLLGAVRGYKPLPEIYALLEQVGTSVTALCNQRG